MKFTTGQILSVLSDRLLAEDGMEGIYKILNFLSQDNLSTHQLTRVALEVRPYVYDQIKWSKEVMERPEWNNDTQWWNNNHADFVKSVSDVYGNEHDLIHIPLEDHDIIDPVEEFKQQYPDKEIIEIKLDDDISPYGNIS